MKRALLWIPIVGLALAVVPASANDDHQHHQAATEKAQGGKSEALTLKGEIVDTGCYLGHEAKGEKHISCATKCIKSGMPMAILTSDGQLYLVTMNHDNPDAYNALKELAGQTVTVTGKAMERGGMKGIDVISYQATAAATK